jgi:hypothetical protein
VGGFSLHAPGASGLQAGRNTPILVRVLYQVFGVSMLKRISTDQLQVGMFLHELCG